MKKNCIKGPWLLPVLLFLLAGCRDNVTNYYPDSEDPGLAIFSNNNNNLMSCYVDGRPWRTNDRIRYSGGLNPGTNYELNVERQITNSVSDTLHFNWLGHFSDTDLFGSISFVLPIPKNFNAVSFSALQGRRLFIDATNGFFSASGNGLNNGSRNGKGNIFFLTAQLDSVAPNIFTGKMSGLFEADFDSLKITRGRFDHLLTEENVRF